MNTQYLINRNNIGETNIRQQAASEQLEPGQLLCKIDQVALTANNVTYAVTGDLLNYWQFFPTAEDGWGMVPMWGYADVVASEHADVPVGERLYGYWPLAGYLVIDADKVTPHGLVDGVAHRQSLNAIYNRYTRTATSPGFEPEIEHLNALLRPMFTTSFLLDDYLWDSSPAAQTFIISSASSKTGYGTAFLLSQNKSKRTDYTVVGLTSAGNVDYVTGLGLYDTVLAYDDVASLPGKDGSAVYADFSGNAKLRAAIHHHYGENLIQDVVIGVTDWTQQGSAKGLPGARAEMFFAPSQAQKRMKEWGTAEFMGRMTADFGAFISFAQSQIDVTPVSGTDEIQQLWADLVKGKVDPRKGFILTL
ncbi:MAG: DUF2855 family protein [Anaerolineae bacterium]